MSWSRLLPACALALSLSACLPQDDTPAPTGATPQGYRVTGSVEGLSGSLVLTDGNDSQAEVNANGKFTFLPRHVPGTSYNVSIVSQPDGQQCVVNNGSGEVSGQDVENIVISCVTPDAAHKFTIGGSVSGLTGTVVLTLNCATPLALSANGSFTFPVLLIGGASYEVAVATQPEHHVCTVANGTGNAVASIDTVAVTCLPKAPVVALDVHNPRELTFSWTAIPGVTHYRLLKNADGASGYTQVGGNLTGTVATDVIPVHLHDWPNALYIVEACSATGCSASAPLSSLPVMLEAIGYFKASNTRPSTAFGASVALSADGSTMVVGGFGDSANTTGVNGQPADYTRSYSGAVYVFVRNGAVWTQQAFLKASNPDIGDNFGSALALSADGNTLAVGAKPEYSNATGINGSQSNNSAPGAGAVYLFRRSGTSWSQQAYIKASNTGSQDKFGHAVALAADGLTLAVGAPQEDSAATTINGNQADNSATDAGAVYVFTSNGTTWSQQAYVKPSNVRAQDLFGWSVALAADGSTLAVGSFGQDGGASGVNGDESDMTANASGAAYVFVRSGTSWSQQAYIKAIATDAEDSFGYSLDLSGDGATLVVGAQYEAGGGAGSSGDPADDSRYSSGAVYVYQRTDGAWASQAYLKASNPETLDWFGRTVAISADGNTLLATAMGEDGSSLGVNGDESDNALSRSGAAYVFRRSGADWTQAAYLKTPNADVDDNLGTSLDVSADGDILAIATFAEDSQATGINGDRSDNSAFGAGAVYLY